jgi:hypothetical protein
MDWAALSRHLMRLSSIILTVTIVYAFLHQTSLFATLAPDAEGLGLLMTLVGAIFAVIFAFVIFVIWGQFTEVENATLRECGSLNELLRFSQHLNPDANRAIRRAVSSYAQNVASSEWHALSERRMDASVEKAFTALMTVVIRTQPVSPAEEAIVQRLIDIARKTGEQRDERIAKSLTRIPPTLLTLVRFIAGALLLLMFVYPFHDWRVGACCFGGLAAILALSNLVMSDTDNPFEGVCNVSVQPFADLAH